jgi:hypothetical protein
MSAALIGGESSYAPEKQTAKAVSSVYLNTLSKSESTLTSQEADIVRQSFHELDQGKYQIFESADDLINKLKSDDSD